MGWILLSPVLFAFLDINLVYAEVPWRVEVKEQLLGVGSFLPLTQPGDSTHAVGLSSQCLYPLSHLESCYYHYYFNDFF